jgi:hypothetical protein
MNSVTYINRYGDEIKFTELSDTEVQFSGFDYSRSGDDFIDPSGGPYIGIGTNIGRYFNDGIERKVKAITYFENKIILSI